jgi:hypothetical protein
MALLAVQAVVVQETEAQVEQGQVVKVLQAVYVQVENMQVVVEVELVLLVLTVALPLTLQVVLVV